LEIDKGELKNIVVQYESFIDNKCTAIVRYDIEHGFFHRDMMTPKGEKIKTPIEIPDLADKIPDNSVIEFVEKDFEVKKKAMVLVTNNEKEFNRVSGLEIENWTKE
jgi:hypothetical protein